MLDIINCDLRSKTKVNQWRSTQSVINWFTSLKNMDELTFMIFDVVDYYPSISEELLSKAITWAKQHTTISDLEEKTIKHARISLLYDHTGKVWMKKDNANAFDVPMGAYDGAEICELVGLYILNILNQELCTDSIGLYRDDGLAVLKNVSGSEADRKRKQITKIFQSLR
jgi:hypothetical protein